MPSPLSWKAHHAALASILFLLVLRAVAARSLGTWILLGAWVVCCQLGGDLVGDDADEWGHSIYIVTAWDVVPLLVPARAALQRPRMRLVPQRPSQHGFRCRRSRPELAHRPGSMRES